MDGKERWMDNVFIDRFWRSVKYEGVYIQESKAGRALKDSLRNWFTFYNQERPHFSLQNMTPDQAYFCPLNRQHNNQCLDKRKGAINLFNVWGPLYGFGLITSISRFFPDPKKRLEAASTLDNI